MTTNDFTSYSNFANDPRRTAQLQLASAIELDMIKVDVWRGPAGGCGFRKGTWSASYQGKTYQFFASVPHESGLDVQGRRLTNIAALHIAGIESGYVTP